MKNIALSLSCFIVSLMALVFFPAIAVSGPITIPCSGEILEIDNEQIDSGEEITCTASEAIYLGPSVTIYPDAMLKLKTPEIYMESSVRIVNGGKLVAITNFPRSRYEIEPNNESPYSTLLKKSDSVYGNINSLSDQDWYRVLLEGTGTLNLIFKHKEVNYILDLFKVSIYKSGGILISSTMIYAPDELTSIDAGIGESGYYYILVETACTQDASGQCNYHRGDQYALLPASFYKTGSIIPELEPNNSQHSANNLTAIGDGAVVGQMSGITDADWFFTDTKGAVNVNLSFSHSYVGYQLNLWKVEIYNSDITLINSTDIYAPDEITEFGFSVENQGRYYIAVTSCQSSSTQCEIHRTDQYILSASLSSM